MGVHPVNSFIGQWCLICALLSPAVGQIQPEALRILQGVAATYGKVSSYQVEVVQTLDDESSAKSMLTRLTYRSPGHYRLETGLLLRRAEPDGAVSISGLTTFDGSRWTGYRPDLGVYAEGQGAGPVDADELGIGPFRSPLERFQEQNGKSIRLMGEVPITTEDGVRPCFLLELTYGHGTSRMWIDKRSYYVHQWQHLGSTYVFRKLNLKPKLSDSTFRFIPPPSARRIENP
jgi:outer membrane lipoprotein-sorting protein